MAFSVSFTCCHRPFGNAHAWFAGQGLGGYCFIGGTKAKPLAAGVRFCLVYLNFVRLETIDLNDWRCTPHHNHLT